MYLKKEGKFLLEKKSKLKDSSNDLVIDIQSQGALLKFIYFDMKDS